MRRGLMLLATASVFACAERDGTDTETQIDSAVPSVSDSVVGDSVMARDTLIAQD